MKTKAIEQLDAAWYAIKAGNDNCAIQALYWAVLELATSPEPNSGSCKTCSKPLTLEDLKRQVENAIAWQKEMPNIFSVGNTST